MGSISWGLWVLESAFYYVSIGFLWWIGALFLVVLSGAGAIIAAFFAGWLWHKILWGFDRWIDRQWNVPK